MSDDWDNWIPSANHIGEDPKVFIHKHEGIWPTNVKGMTPEQMLHAARWASDNIYAACAAMDKGNGARAVSMLRKARAATLAIEGVLLRLEEEHDQEND